MTESARIVHHMACLAEHVNKRLQTMDAWQWMLDGYVIPEAEMDVDIREALTKLKKLNFRYNQIWKRRSGVLRIDTSGLPDTPDLRMRSCPVLERRWVMRMWRKGDWSVVEEGEDGKVRKLYAFNEGKFRWKLN